MLAVPQLNTACWNVSFSTVFRRWEEGRTEEEENSERERANRAEAQASLSSKQCMNSQTGTGNAFIPLPQFLCGSHVAMNKDVKGLYYQDSAEGKRPTKDCKSEPKFRNTGTDDWHETWSSVVTNVFLLLHFGGLVGILFEYFHVVPGTGSGLCVKSILMCL